MSLRVVRPHRGGPGQKKKQLNSQWFDWKRYMISLGRGEAKSVVGSVEGRVIGVPRDDEE